MLDTNICIYIIKKRPMQVIDRLRTQNISDVMISIITAAELEYGIQKSSNPQANKIALAGFMAPFEIPPFDSFASKHYGRIRYQLEKKGNPIGGMDMLIAAHAISLDATLVTNNIKEFSRVADLKLENWV